MAQGKFWSDFKAFAMRGNVIDMAVGVVVGGAFGKIVSSLVSDIIMPVVGALVGGLNFTDWKWTIVKAQEAVLDPGTQEVVKAAKDAVTINYGNLLQVITDFVIIAFCIFLVIRAIAKLSDAVKKEEAAAAEPAAPAPKADDVVLLEEIRDLLKERK